MNFCKCDICKKNEANNSWDYIITKKGIGKVRNYTPGKDVVHYENGKEVSRENSTSYSTGKVSTVIERGTANICRKCRIIYSVIYSVIISFLITVLLELFCLLVEGDNFKVGAIFGHFEMTLFFVAIFALTPLMKIIILKMHIAKEKGIKAFWRVKSKIWE